jgi:hypothetical protein
VEAVRRLLAEQRERVAPVAVDRKRAQRDDGHAEVDAEDSDEDQVDCLRHIPARVAGLLGHIRDCLDPGVGEHRERQRKDRVVPARDRPEVHLVDQERRLQHEERADDDDHDLRREVGDRQEEVELRRFADPADVQRGQRGDDDEAADDVARVVRQRRPERAEVVRHEERRDRDRQDVVERQRPAGEERHELVERVPREARGAPRLREHRRSLRVRLRRQGEEPPGEHEDDRRQAERIERDETERVVDRRADIAVRGGEQATEADAAA